MTELMKFDANNKATMSSREIAELTGKGHRHVLRDIDKLNEYYEKLTMPKCEQGFYTHERTGNQQHKEYFLTKIQTLDLMTGYSIELRIKVNRRWEELETKKQIPTTYKDALIALVAKIEETEQLALQVNNLETVLDIRLDWVSIIKIAQFNKVSEKAFDWHILKTKSKELGYEIKRAESVRYKYQNLYHLNVFRACYPKYNYNLK